MFSQLISSLVILSEYKHHSSEYTTVISRQHLPIPDTVMAFEKLLLCTSVVHLLFHFLNVSSNRLNYLGSVNSNTRNRTIPCNVNKTVLITCLFLRWRVVLSCSQKSKRIPKTAQDYTWLSILSSGVWKLKSINTSDEHSTMVTLLQRLELQTRLSVRTQNTRRGITDFDKRIVVCIVGSACFYHQLLEMKSR